jgi:hypothetical protein
VSRPTLDFVPYSRNRSRQCTENTSNSATGAARWPGQSPEAIQEDFPLLKRSQIYGAIAFLDHKAEIDKHLEDTKREFEGSGIPIAQANPVLLGGEDPTGQSLAFDFRRITT